MTCSCGCKYGDTYVSMIGIFIEELKDNLREYLNSFSVQFNFLENLNSYRRKRQSVFIAFVFRSSSQRPEVLEYFWLIDSSNKV